MPASNSFETREPRRRWRSGGASVAEEDAAGAAEDEEGADEQQGQAEDRDEDRQRGDDAGSHQLRRGDERVAEAAGGGQGFDPEQDGGALDEPGCRGASDEGDDPE